MSTVMSHARWLALTAALSPILSAQQKPATAAPAVRLQPAPAQQPQAQAELIQKRKDKLGKPVFQKAPWLFDFDAAKKQAKEQDKLLLVYFTRSYAY